MSPALSYLICCAERTGSTLLGDALIGTGIAGYPRSYFNRVAHYNPSIQRLLGNAKDDDQYLAKVIVAATTPNGVFGAKVHWEHFLRLMVKAERSPQAHEGAVPASASERLREHFPDRSVRIEDYYGRTAYAPRSYDEQLTPLFDRLKRKYGYTEEQTQPYTFNLQPFFADNNVAQQGYPSSEPFQAMQKGVVAKFFLFADAGYPPYGTTLVTTTKLVAEKPYVIKRFVRATLEGWKSYVKGDPSAANALIKIDNPKMGDEQIAFGIKRMNELKVVDGGDAATMGIGVMTETRWKATYDFLVAEGLLDKSVDWNRAFTTEFIKDLKIVAK